jgi:hypothetical protein
MDPRSGAARRVSDRDRDFSEFYAARGASLRATAYLLCADWHLADDPCTS